MVGFCLTGNICPEVSILLAQIVLGDFSSWVEAHRAGSGQYALPPLPPNGEPQQMLINGINGPFPVPQNVKAQRLCTKSLLLEVLSLEIKIEEGTCRDCEGQPCEGKSEVKIEVPQAPVTP